MDPLTLSAWMCFLSTAQMALLNSFVLPDLDAWKINSLFELMGCIFAVSSSSSHPLSVFPGRVAAVSADKYLATEYIQLLNNVDCWACRARLGQA